MNTIKKTTTYTKTMYEMAKDIAKSLGLTFHEYIRHLIALNIQMQKVPVERMDDATAKEIVQGMKDFKEGKYVTLRSEKDVEKLFD